MRKPYPHEDEALWVADEKGPFVGEFRFPYRYEAWWSLDDEDQEAVLRQGWKRFRVERGGSPLTGDWLVDADLIQAGRARGQALLEQWPELGFRVNREGVQAIWLNDRPDIVIEEDPYLSIIDLAQLLLKKGWPDVSFALPALSSEVTKKWALRQHARVDSALRSAVRLFGGT